MNVAIEFDDEKSEDYVNEVAVVVQEACDPEWDGKAKVAIDRNLLRQIRYLLDQGYEHVCDRPDFGVNSVEAIWDAARVPVLTNDQELEGEYRFRDNERL
ncbi:hypothetical protein JI721_12120 [Alicyclobacillus cycloheptanicus]|uniref:Uncharacterized protein n=1 Tax=Alicyclobacillus cycloheptanicus TaxID=1457 RepID=A0ABT9XLS1_9BACL|nr:hypothetical protein [Alicyclobacillus cycloheptanicus]MDQ0191261.1 hypothetical protein [Alicyclobacillus cycloheptanicus]WDM00462.1 hypothetical protein JI721_12120 [Alicyclobacillus cycloheptanicus]